MPDCQVAIGVAGGDHASFPIQGTSLEITPPLRKALSEGLSGLIKISH